MKCPTCGMENEPSAAFCDQCGAALGAAAPLPSGSTPKATPAQPQITPPPPAPPLPPRAQPAPSVPPVQPSFRPPPPETVGMPVVPFHLMIGNQSVAVPLQKEVVIGRADAAGASNPDVDLTPHGGTSDAGVSRKHAQFIWQGRWVIEDLNSTNGTFLRGQRLFPGTQTPINNGEVFQIGKLEITFFTQ